MFLAIDKIIPGMKAIRDVANLNGALLLAAGTSLSPEVLRRLRMWGIKGLHVEGDDPDRAASERGGEIEPGRLREAEATVNWRWKHVQERGATIDRIRDWAIRRTARRLASKKPVTTRVA